MVGDDLDLDVESGRKPKRRTILRSLGGLGVGMALAGCSGLQSHDYEALPVRLDETTKPEEYEFRTENAIEQSQSFERDDETVEATITSYSVSYHREGAGFLDSVALGTLSSPLVEETGELSNPITALSTEELLRDSPTDELLEPWAIDGDWSRDPVSVQTDPGELFEESVTIETFAGVSTGDEFVLLNVVRHEHLDDVVFVGSARSKPIESRKESLVGPEGYVSQERVDETVKRVTALLPHFVHEEPSTPTPDSSMDATIGEFVALQETLGETLTAAGKVNSEFATARSDLEAMLYGVLVADDLDRFRDAPLPYGFDREAIFSAKAPDVDDTEDVPLPEPPETVADWTRHVDRFETLRDESDQRREAVAEAAEDLRRHVEQNVSLYAGQEGHDPEVPLHPRFADEPLPLATSVWTIFHELTPLKHSHREVHAGFEDVVKTVGQALADPPTATETPDCPQSELRCSQAQITVVIGYGGWYNGFGHAWIRHTAKRHFYTFTGPDCEAVEHDHLPPQIHSESWGWYGDTDFRDDSDNEIQCEVPAWATDDCSSGKLESPTTYEQFLVNLEYDLENKDRNWRFRYNCLDYALRALEYADSDRAEELREKAKSAGYTDNSVPDQMCEYDYIYPKHYEDYDV